jgi:AcrR family transcriptional regulator
MDLLLIKVTELFKKHGIKSLTMGDIATLLGISKKTLYLNAKNKNDLVKQFVVNYLTNEQQVIENINTGSMNAIENFISISTIIVEHIKGIKKETVNELEKYYTEAFKLIEKHRTGFMFNLIHHNIQQGKEQGWYRESIDTSAACFFYMNLSKAIFNHENEIMNFRLSEIIKEMLQYHLFAIVSDKGHNYITEHKIVN